MSKKIDDSFEAFINEFEKNKGEISNIMKDEIKSLISEVRFWSYFWGLVTGVTIGGFGMMIAIIIFVIDK